MSEKVEKFKKSSKKERIAHLEGMKKLNEKQLKQLQDAMNSQKGIMEKIKISEELIEKELEKLKK
jgi:F0F1-type ATP synthase delta subunit